MVKRRERLQGESRRIKRAARRQHGHIGAREGVGVDPLAEPDGQPADVRIQGAGGCESQHRRAFRVRQDGQHGDLTRNRAEEVADDGEIRAGLVGGDPRQGERRLGRAGQRGVGEEPLIVQRFAAEGADRERHIPRGGHDLIGRVRENHRREGVGQGEGDVGLDRGVAEHVTAIDGKINRVTRRDRGAQVKAARIGGVPPRLPVQSNRHLHGPTVAREELAHRPRDPRGRGGPADETGDATSARMQGEPTRRDPVGGPAGGVFPDLRGDVGSTPPRRSQRLLCRVSVEVESAEVRGRPAVGPGPVRIASGNAEGRGHVETERRAKPCVPGGVEPGRFIRAQRTVEEQHLVNQALEKLRQRRTTRPAVQGADGEPDVRINAPECRVIRLCRQPAIHVEPGEAVGTIQRADDVVPHAYGRFGGRDAHPARRIAQREGELAAFQAHVEPGIGGCAIPGHAFVDQLHHPRRRAGGLRPIPERDGETVGAQVRKVRVTHQIVDPIKAERLSHPARGERGAAFENAPQTGDCVGGLIVPPEPVDQPLRWRRALRPAQTEASGGVERAQLMIGERPGADHDFVNQPVEGRVAVVVAADAEVGRCIGQRLQTDLLRGHQQAVDVKPHRRLIVSPRDM
ncbi:MAG: hypothetical protein BWX84_01925 [Verrucomicrobia bacterium ADurb.Bin118]|nr:MAG: hypothetical protein BWX84_01925 [Verrucomicrobia bacterium ADurb.Bin118]